MDTKLRKSKSLQIWLCFFMGVNIIITMTILSLIMLQNKNYNYYRIKDVVGSDWFLYVMAAVSIAGIFMFVLSIVKLRLKHAFDVDLARFFGYFWIEVKITASVLVIALFTEISNIYSGSNLYSIIIPIIITAFCGWWFYFMLVDLIVNKSRMFTNNIINSILKRYKVFESKKSFQKGMMLRAYLLIAAEAVLVFMAVAALSGSGFLSFLSVAAGIYLIYRYMRRYRNTVNDIGHVMDHIEGIKSGQMKEAYTVLPEADLFPAQENLNQIQDGFSMAVEEKIRSERMKIELITNVSHDLKTPLTSIISYVELLSREEELPQHVKDYIKILSQKSERLKTLIQDLFDLSKVNSGNIVVEKEKLDIGKVVTQTLADMNEEITQSELTFKVRVPPEHLFITSDGNKLYRVFQNLVTNALKYSLKGSRVYVDAEVNDGKAVVIIKNTANYEMNFDEGEIVERFVRGDKARTSEGTGLGLAIAQSFTHACGGEFKVKVDGDLFKVMLNFDLCE